MLTARRWLWLMSAVSAAVIVSFTCTDVLAPSIRRWIDCNTPGVTCQSYYDFQRPALPAAPASLGGSL